MLWAICKLALDCVRICLFYAQMHTADIDRMQLVELDNLRHQLRLTKRELCEASDIDPSTYTRWMRHVRGLSGGSCPQPRSIKAIRDVLKARIDGCIASQAAAPVHPMPLAS